MGKLALSGFAALTAACALAEVSFKTDAFELKLGDDATVKSLRLTANGEECVDAREPIPMFSTTQDRPFNNEIKLNYPNKRTTYPANRITRAGDLLTVGFEIAPYEAVVKVTIKSGYLVFELIDFKVTEKSYGKYLEMDTPPVRDFRIAQLPVKRRVNFGEWVNAMWDDKSAVAVMSVEPLVEIDHERRHQFEILTASLHRGYQLRGGKAVVIAAPGREAFLNAVDQLENDWKLPRGVASRRSDKINVSYFWTPELTPENVDDHIAWAKMGGFRMMLVYYPSYAKGGLPYSYLGDYEWNEHYPNGEADLKRVLKRIKEAGITPGMHVLQTHIGLKSKYVTPIADGRLNLTRHFTLARALPSDGEIAEIFVNENPTDSVMREKCRVLQFGGELFLYAGFTTTPPYRFFGVKRGAYATKTAAHPKFERGGILDISEFGATSCYANQNTTLPDEVGDKLAKIYNCGFDFVYFDGSEGVNPPCGINVSLAQMRTIKKFNHPPLFTEGAAKSHFGWHLQSGANAFDVFKPEVFKAMIAEFPLFEAPIMQQNFTRLDFGWWGIYTPDTEYEGVKTMGTQPDMWEYGTSKAAAWDCPVAVMSELKDRQAHAHIGDLFEVLRRWEDVRAKKWLTNEQRQALRDPKREFHLYLNERGEYELCEIEMLPMPAKADHLRGFIFERAGKRTIAYWHTSGKGIVEWNFGANGQRETREISTLAYLETNLTVSEAKNVFAAAIAQE